jgi:methyl-accepting chemotaxis protein
MTLSTSSVTNAMEESLHGITQQGAELIHARVDSKYKELSSIATNDLFWSEHISESRLYSLLDRARELEGYLDLVFVSKAGTAYSSNGTSSPIGENESFRAGMAGNRYIGEPVPTGEGDATVMTYSVPVYNSADAIVGVLIMTSDGYELSDLIKDITYAKTGYSFVINKEGVMIAHPDRTMVLTQDRTLEKAKANPEQQGLAAIMERMIAGETGMGGYTYKGVTKYAGTRPSRTPTGSWR